MNDTKKLMIRARCNAQDKMHDHQTAIGAINSLEQLNKFLDKFCDNENRPIPVGSGPQVFLGSDIKALRKVIEPRMRHLESFLEVYLEHHEH